MKNILSILFLFISSFSFGQTIVPIENLKGYIETSGQTYYYKDVNGVFDKFIGNWRYQDSELNPSKIVEISFLKRTMVMSGIQTKYHDRIYALIKYTHNGTVVYDTYPVNLPPLLNRGNNIVGGTFSVPSNTNKLDLFYSEPGLGGKRGYLTIEYDDNGGSPILNWKVQSFRELTKPFKMPTVMVLEKELM